MYSRWRSILTSIDHTITLSSILASSIAANAYCDLHHFSFITHSTSPHHSLKRFILSSRSYFYWRWLGGTKIWKDEVSKAVMEQLSGDWEMVKIMNYSVDKMPCPVFPSFCFPAQCPAGCTCTLAGVVTCQGLQEIVPFLPNNATQLWANCLMNRWSFFIFCSLERFIPNPL